MSADLVPILAEQSALGTRLAALETILAESTHGTRLAELDKLVAKQSALDTRLEELDTIIANQTRLGKRFIWLLILPLFITIGVITMFFVLRAGLSDVSRLTQELTIERYMLLDDNYAMAIDQYEQLDKTQENESIQARLGVLYFEFDPKKFKDKAIQKLEIAKRLKPMYWMTYRNLTYIYVRTGEEKNAIDAGEQALKLNRSDAITYNNLAWVYATSKDQKIYNLERAEEYANMAYMLTRGKNPNVLDTAAEIDFRKGGSPDKELAQSLIRSAITFAPNGDKKRFQDHLKELFPNEKP